MIPKIHRTTTTLFVLFQVHSPSSKGKWSSLSGRWYFAYIHTSKYHTYTWYYEGTKRGVFAFCSDVGALHSQSYKHTYVCRIASRESFVLRMKFHRIPVYPKEILTSAQTSIGITVFRPAQPSGNNSGITWSCRELTDNWAPIAALFLLLFCLARKRHFNIFFCAEARHRTCLATQALNFRLCLLR